MNSTNTNVSSHYTSDDNTVDTTNVTINIETKTNARLDLNINITRNSSTGKLRHNFKPNSHSNKRPVEKSLPVKNEKFEQVSMFDRWADGV
jgi:hypothetical protein